jgi:hypothetical protein
LDSTRTLLIGTALVEVAAGVALLSLPSVAIWLLLGVDQPALEALSVVYNVGVVLVLATAGAVAGMRGVLLWPAVVLHTGLAVWCVIPLAAADGRT